MPMVLFTAGRGKLDTEEESIGDPKLQIEVVTNQDEEPMQIDSASPNAKLSVPELSDKIEEESPTIETDKSNVEAKNLESSQPIESDLQSNNDDVIIENVNQGDSEDESPKSIDQSFNSEEDKDKITEEKGQQTAVKNFVTSKFYNGINVGDTNFDETFTLHPAAQPQARLASAQPHLAQPQSHSKLTPEHIKLAATQSTLAAPYPFSYFGHGYMEPQPIQVYSHSLPYFPTPPCTVAILPTGQFQYVCPSDLSLHYR